MGSPKKTKKSHKRAHYQLESHPTKVDAALESADLFLTTAQNIGELANVPFLGNAAGLVLSILSIVQEVRDNKSAFEQVASEAYTQVESLTNLIKHLLDEEGTYGKKRIRRRLVLLNTDVEKLVTILTKVEKFAHVKLNRSLMQRVLYWRYDLQTIRQFRDEMNKAHKDFVQRSQVILRFDLNKVEEKTDRILEHMERREARDAAASSSSSDKLAPQGTPNHSPSVSPLAANVSWGQSFPPPGGGSGGNTYVNSMVNSGNVSTTTHNGNVINVGSPQSSMDFMPPSGPFFNHQIPTSPYWSHQMS